MTTTFDLLLIHATCWLPDDKGSVRPTQTNIGIKEGRILEISSKLNSNQSLQTLDLSGKDIFPGFIDTQVHFREPGLEHKEDLQTGTAGAIQGGITSIFEMPNTSPNTVTARDLSNKIERAKNRAWCDFAFYMGAAEENLDDLADLESLPGCSGIKVFMGSSTGSLLVHDPEHLKRLVHSGVRRFAVHAEDELRLIERKKIVTEAPGDVKLHPIWRDETVALNATQLITKLALEAKRPVHVLHISTKQEIKYLRELKKTLPLNKPQLISVECTPQHLSLSAPEAYETIGTFAQMNPPIRSIDHQEELWRGINDGTVDIIGSDHAPHTIEEKTKNSYPNTPSGMTGVQTSVPIMFDHVNKGRLSIEKLVQLMVLNPVKLFGIKNQGAIQIGMDATFTVMDLKKTQTITNDWIESRSGWTPFHNRTVTGWPTHTIIRGQVVMANGEKKGTPLGTPLNFIN